MSYTPRHLIRGEDAYKFKMTMGTSTSADELYRTLINVDESVRPFFTMLPMAGNTVMCSVPTAIAEEVLDKTLKALDDAVIGFLAKSVQPIAAALA